VFHSIKPAGMKLLRRLPSEIKSDPEDLSLKYSVTGLVIVSIHLSLSDCESNGKREAISRQNFSASSVSSVGILHLASHDGHLQLRKGQPVFVAIQFG